MKYKTTIEIVSEADDRHDAAEIVGEYLSGNLVSGVDMKCVTKPVRNYSAYAIGLAAIILLLAIRITPAAFIGNTQAISAAGAANSAIIPPLKTSAVEKKEAGFKKTWQDRQTKTALDFIKR